MFRFEQRQDGKLVRATVDDCYEMLRRDYLSPSQEKVLGGVDLEFYLDAEDAAEWERSIEDARSDGVTV